MLVLVLKLNDLSHWRRNQLLMRKGRNLSTRSGLTINVEDEQYLSKGNLAQASGHGLIEVDLNDLRIGVKASLKQNLYENAIFLANKLGTLNNSKAALMNTFSHSFWDGLSARRLPSRPSLLAWKTVGYAFFIRCDSFLGIGVPSMLWIAMVYYLHIVRTSWKKRTAN